MADQHGKEIQTVVKYVKEAILAVEAEGTTVQVEKLELTLKAVEVMTAGGELKLKIPILGDIGGGLEMSAQNTQVVTLTLVPPKGKELLGAPDIKKELKEAILTIKEGVKSAADNEPKFALENSAVELNFVVTGEGKINVVVKADTKAEETHSMKLYLKAIS